MEYDKQFKASISKALREVERDLSLSGNSLVDETPLPKISGQVRLKSMVVLLQRNFITREPDNLIRHWKELKLRKRVAEQDEKISLLINTMDLLLTSGSDLKSKTAPLGATKYHESNDQW